MVNGGRELLKFVGIEFECRRARLTPDSRLQKMGSPDACRQGQDQPYAEEKVDN